MDISMFTDVNVMFLFLEKCLYMITTNASSLIKFEANAVMVNLPTAKTNPSTILKRMG